MIKHVAKAYAKQAYRTILVAYRDMTREDYDQMIEDAITENEI
jgi:magnesium-transporting ATPase (P-type)